MLQSINTDMLYPIAISIDSFLIIKIQVCSNYFMYLFLVKNPQSFWPQSPLRRTGGDTTRVNALW